MPLKPSEIVKDGLYYSEETDNYYLVTEVTAVEAKFDVYTCDDRPVRPAKSSRRLFAGMMTERVPSPYSVDEIGV